MSTSDEASLLAGHILRLITLDRFTPTEIQTILSTELALGENTNEFIEVYEATNAKGLYQSIGLTIPSEIALSPWSSIELHLSKNVSVFLPEIRSLLPYPYELGTEPDAPPLFSGIFSYQTTDITVEFSPSNARISTVVLSKPPSRVRP